MSFLGIDIGTGGCKALVYTSEGVELASSFREYAVTHPLPGRAELDPDEVIRNCFKVIAEVNARIKEPVTAMAVSSQGEAFTAVDSRGNTLCHAMVSSDSRSSELSVSWSNAFGLADIYRITGHTPHPLFTLFKLLWIRDNQPEIWKQARYYLCFEDLLLYRLGIEPRISWSLAGRTMMFDVIRHTWSPDILDAAGIHADQLAIPAAAGEITGCIALEKGRELGFVNPVFTVAGGHDQTCAALGAGVTRPGMCMYATGSVECFCPVLEAPRFSEALRLHNLCCYDYTIRGMYTSVAYSLTGGNLLRWWRDTLGETERQHAGSAGINPYTLLLDAMPVAPTDLLVLPYFSATGTPYFDTRARGAILGLQLTTEKGAMIKALLEGVALEMKLNLELMEDSGIHIDTFIATGGGTRHPAWTQLKADVLNRPVKVREVSEAGCFGAAMLACSAANRIPVAHLVARPAEEEMTFTPDPGRAVIYADTYAAYRKLYPALRPFWTPEP